LPFTYEKTQKPLLPSCSIYYAQRLVLVPDWQSSRKCSKITSVRSAHTLTNHRAVWVSILDAQTAW